MVIQFTLLDTVTLGWDHGLSIQVGDEGEECIAVIAFIGYDSIGMFTSQERLCLRNIGLLTRSENETAWIA